MLKLVRILIVIGIPGIFWGAWFVAPELLDSTNLRYLSGVVAVLWALELHFLTKLGTVGDVPGLSSKEHERLVFRLAAIRNRIWWVGGVGLACAIVLWVMAALNLPGGSPRYAAAAGFLIGVSLSYLILIPGWFGECQRFIDEVKRRDAMAKRRSEMMKAMAPSPKHGTTSA